MKLNKNFEIKETLHGYKLIKQITVMDKKTKQPKPGTDETFYGTMEQALIGFLRYSTGDPETLDELRVKVMSIRDEIASLRNDIISERGEIRSVRP